MIEIIAEIGKNFVVTEKEEPLKILLSRTRNLIQQAKEIGFNTVKFQVHNVEDEIHPNSDITSPHFNQDRISWVKRNTYPIEFWWDIKEYCRNLDIEFLATPMSRGAAILLNEEIGIDRWKIGSGDILDFVMLDYIRDSNKPIILSSGMSTLEELKKSYEYLKKKNENITILHCVSQYPCSLSALNLKTIPFLQKIFPEAKIGFSDHSLGIEGSLMAIKLGATLIEKHFTLDKNAWGPDHKASLLPNEMKELVKRIENNDFLEPTSETLGIETKYLQNEEAVFRPVFRKGLYAARELIKGEMYESDMMYALRPQSVGGSPSEKYPEFLGKFVGSDYKKYDAIKL